MLKIKNIMNHTVFILTGLYFIRTYTTRSIKYNSISFSLGMFAQAI